jgi:hypothetical protein
MHRRRCLILRACDLPVTPNEIARDCTVLFSPSLRQLKISRTSGWIMLTSHMLKYNSGGCSSFMIEEVYTVTRQHITRTIFLAIAMLTFFSFSRNHISYYLPAGLRSAFIQQPPRQLTAAPSPSLPTQMPTTAGGLAVSSFKDFTSHQTFSLP